MAILGITFKEDVPDLRNTRVVDIVHELVDFGVEVLVHDPLADSREAKQYYGLELVSLESLQAVDAVVVAVMHKTYIQMGLSGIAGLCTNGRPIVVDVKGAYGAAEAQELDITYWKL